MALGKASIWAKYSHRVWERFPHQANSIPRNSNFDMFIKNRTFKGNLTKYKLGVATGVPAGAFFSSKITFFKN